MPKPKGQKNGNNKAKHSKLMAQKKNKLKQESDLRKERLRAIIKKAKED
ncbi:hypothetical protein [Psychroserpens luteus]|uniref:Uncharacterized protein n=1 Tax=Psychroserpens luteus TaxID=1434066 RepID=A0ABW5ZQQ4_9FLAO|nr:hypothetical protein [Psychroserpens luteus]